MSSSSVTIITPTFNRAHTLKRVYESLKNQTFKGFKWLIMDDGSTDNTETLIQQFIEEKFIPIEYRKNPNAKKFYTVFSAIESVDTDYFTILDSDDAYPVRALEILVNEADKLDRSKFISVIGHSEDENGNLYGDFFTGDGFDGSNFDMRYKYKIKGDKNGIFIREPYQNYLKGFDYSAYKHKYAPQQIFFNIYDADGMKTRFINEIIRTYYYDETDKYSMSKDRIKASSYFGLKDAHLSFINSYAFKFFSYPILFLKNILRFETYSFLMNENLGENIKMIKSNKLKILAWILAPVSFLMSKRQN